MHSLSVIATLSIKKAGETFAEQQGIPVMQKALDIIDGDEFEALLRRKDSLDDPFDDEFYARACAELLNVAESVGCDYLYTMAPLSGTRWQYVIDGSCTPDAGDEFSQLGQEEDIGDWGPAPLEAMRTGQVTSSGVTRDEWGYQISSYQSIRNSRGVAVGIIGCDFNVEVLMATIRQRVTVIIITSAVFLVLGIAVIMLLARNIFDSLARISLAMGAIAQGRADLTAHIPEEGDNELTALARSCNKVIGSLDRMVGSLQGETSVLAETGTELRDRMAENVGQIRSAVDTVGDITERILSQARQIESITAEMRSVETEIEGLDARIGEQSAAIQQSTSAVEQISANILSVDRNIGVITSEYANLVKESAAGRRMQDSVSEQIESIAKQSENLTEANAAIAAIAEQTNLLAMNAAIEAAHAGDFGKGFGVVADEIRALAETSATQSSSIKQLLEGISAAISGIVDASKKSADSFESVGAKIILLDKRIKEVQSGMAEQNEGVANILQGMKQLDGTTANITGAASHMKGASARVFGSIKELELSAADTQAKASAVTGGMERMKAAAQNAMDASDRSRAATQKVSDMINGFKV